MIHDCFVQYTHSLCVIIIDGGYSHIIQRNIFHQLGIFYGQQVEVVMPVKFSHSKVEWIFIMHILLLVYFWLIHYFILIKCQRKFNRWNKRFPSLIKKLQRDWTHRTSMRKSSEHNLIKPNLNPTHTSNHKLKIINKILLKIPPKTLKI